MKRWLLLGSVLAAIPASAQQIDFSHGGPLNVTAEDGLEWRQNEQTVVATGNAHATRENVTVIADQLIAHYRKKPTATAPGKPGEPVTTQAAPTAPAAPAAPAAPPSAGGLPADADTSSNEIYRVEAIGNVRIDTPTDHATGERAIYDIDQAVMLMTGRNLRLITPNDTLTARDSMEYWSQRHMAVARGDAVVTTNDARRIAADVLVAYTTEGQAPGTQAPAKPVPAAAHPGAPATPADPLAASGKLQKVEAFGHVSVRTTTDIVTGDRGVYVPETGIARVAGNVRITRGQNQLNGQEAEVNLKTGISRLLSGSDGRVQGYVVPNDASTQGAIPGDKPAGTPGAAAPGSGTKPAKGKPTP
jgi:lipopolysaccharide export system protein LptA